MIGSLVVGGRVRHRFNLRMCRTHSAPTPRLNRGVGVLDTYDHVRFARE